MYRLLYCALAFHVAIGVAAPASAEAAEPLATGLSATDQNNQNTMIGRGPSPVLAVGLGAGKAPLPCPEFCVPRPASDPKLTRVDERVIFEFIAAHPGAEARRGIDTRRAARAMIAKFPPVGPAPHPETAVTRTEFRPALDPVLAEPTTTSPE